MDLPFLYIMFLPHNTHGLIEILIHSHDSPHGIASDQETQVTAREVWQCALDHRIHRSGHVSTVLKQLL